MDNIFIFLLVPISIWLLILSFFVYQNNIHYRKIAGKAKEIDLKKLLEEVLKSEDQNKKDVKKIFAQLEKLQSDGMAHIQKLGLVRYNPFNDTGGDHSFSLSALDGNGNGFLLTGLHTREKARFYIKSIKIGKASRELSDEEKRSIELAMKS